MLQMASGSDIFSGRERRLDHRFDVDLEAVLRAYRVASLPSRMIDLSVSGALIRAHGHEFRSGDELLVSVRGIEVVATVAWTRDIFLGLVFHRRLDPHQMALLKR